MLRLHLWREWREHRVALLMLFLVLPLLAWGFADVAPRKALGDPLLQSGAALTFVVVALVATGGELLGAERRGSGLRWLERLPAGLNVAFLAKLVFLVLTTVLAACYGLGVARSLALLRGVAPKSIRWEWLSFLAGVALVLWTFACSAWALRGGVAIFAAALVLGSIGYPVWRVVAAGYQPTSTEFRVLAALLVSGALLGAWLAFVHGGRFGRGAVRATFLGLAPAAAVLLGTASWSAIRLGEREIFDPLAPDFHLSGHLITADGRFVFACGAHMLWRWDSDAIPQHAMRLDLTTGEFEDLGTFISLTVRQQGDERGLPHPDEFLLVVAEQATPLVFDASSGEPRPWDAKKKDVHWYSKGLGFYVMPRPGQPARIHDPFRGRDYPADELEEYMRGELLVRPGRWLCSGNTAGWRWLDPDTRELTNVDWPRSSEPLVLHQDGRILLSDEEHGLRVVDPEQGTSYTLDSQGIAAENIERNWSGLHVPDRIRDPVADASGPIVLRTYGDAWLVVDPDLTTVRRVAVPGELELLLRVGQTAIVSDWSHDTLERLDLESGERAPLWPPPVR